MKEYLIFTTEGYTLAPNIDVKVDNCQLLGRITANDFKSAIDNLWIQNPWIEQSGFDKSKCFVVEIVNDFLKKNIRSLIDYLWVVEHHHFQENNHPTNHIFRVLRELNAYITQNE